jgi:hypothetical protein
MSQQDAASSPLYGKSIVTVEDEGITQIQLRRLLTHAGLRVVGQAFNRTRESRR